MRDGFYILEHRVDLTPYKPMAADLQPLTFRAFAVWPGLDIAERGESWHWLPCLTEGRKR